MLFNNADGNYEASYKPNVLAFADVDENSTNVQWIPPSIYKSSCTIDVRYFPFDEQTCEMRFGSWTFDAQQVVLKRDKPMVNLEDYLPSGTWDIIEAPAYEVYSPETNRMELVYNFKIRRKTLFYTVNLIIPTVLISFLSIFVFYLPTDEGEKMTLCISILLALVVFLLLVSKILPPTSMVIPLISKYLIFTLMMNIVTILNTVIIINWNYRTPRTHTMPRWVRVLFIEFLPKVLFMRKPESPEKKKKLDELLNLEREMDRLSNKSTTSEHVANSEHKKRKHIRNTSMECATLDLHPTLDYQEVSTQKAGANERQLTANVYSTCMSERPKQQQHRNLDKFAALNKKMIHMKKNGEHRLDAKLARDALNYDEQENDCLLNDSIDIATPSKVIMQQRNSKSNRTRYESYQSREQLDKRHTNSHYSSNVHKRSQFRKSHSHSLECASDKSEDERPIEFSPDVLEAADKVTYITNHIKTENDYEEVFALFLIIHFSLG